MKTFLIDDKPYSYPTSWEEIPYRQFLQIAPIRANKDLSPLQRGGRYVVLLTGLEQEIIDAAEPKLVLSILEQLMFLSEEPTDVVVTEFEINKETYYVKDLDLATYGQFANYEQVGYMYKKNPLAGIPKQLAMLCRKAGESPEDLPDAELDRRAELFLDLSTTTVIGVASFFETAACAIRNAIASSSAVQAQVAELGKVKAALLAQLDADIVSASVGTARLTFTRRLYARIIRWCLQ